MDVSTLKESMRSLQETLPAVPERLTALLAEETSLRQAAEEFLELVERRQSEAAELFTRIEAVLGTTRRETAEQALALAQAPDPAAVLAEPPLAFGDRLRKLLPAVLPPQEALVSNWALLNQSKQERRDAQSTALGALTERLGSGRERLGIGADDLQREGRALQSAAEAVRATISDEVEKLGAELEALQRGVAHDIDEVRRDVDGFEGSFVARIGQLRDGMRQEVEAREEDTRKRLEEVRDLVEDAVHGVGHSLGRLTELLKEARDETDGSRSDLQPAFRDVEGHIQPIKHAIEAVREAAQLVGIPF